MKLMDRASLDFSISELNRFIVLYHRKDIDELLTTLAVDFVFLWFISRVILKNGRMNNILLYY